MTIRILAGLRDVADCYDGFIIDLWGVVHDGVTPYPGVRETLERLRSLGKRTVLLSNAPRRAFSLIEMMNAMGLPRSLYDQVMSSGEAVHLEMLRRTDPWFATLGRRCLHIGPERDKNIFEGLRLDLVADVADADFLMNTGPDRDETLADFVPLLEASARRGLPMVCANPDLVVIRQGVPLICAGALARYYEDLGGSVRYRGKPDSAIYDVCLDLLGVNDRRRILAIGDAFHTDIAGAAAAGLDSVLCTGGIHAAEIGTRYGEQPDPERIEAVIAAHGGVRPSAAIGGFVW